MVSNTQSKKFRFNFVTQENAAIRSVVLALALISLSKDVCAQDAAKQPYVRNVAIVPMQWEGESLKIGVGDRLRDDFTKIYPEVVASSKKFRLVENELAKQLWSDAEGRGQLTKEHELHAFLVFSVANQGEVMRVSARLLSPKLETYLVESMNISARDLYAYDATRREYLIKKLVFSLINRMPNDAYVASVQGGYVSLTAGSEQGLRPKEEIEVRRVFIAAAHPADGSWLNFANTSQGKIQILEVKPNSSVARVVKETFSGAIKAGDGIQIREIPSRKFFAEAQAKKSAYEIQEEAVVVVAPENTWKKTELPKAKPVEKSDKVALAKPLEDQNSKQEEIAAPVSEEETAAAEQSTQVQEDAIQMHRENPRVVLPKAAQIYFGLEQWSVSGGASASSEFPLYLLNHVAVSYPMDRYDPFDVEAIGRLRYGTTKKGDYNSLGGGLRGIFRQSLDVGALQNTRLGVEGLLEIESVSGETYGGHTAVFASGFGGVEGQTYLMDKPLQFSSDLVLTPFALGQAGVGGKLKTIGNTMGFGLRGEALVLEDRLDMLWGGALEFNSMSQTAGKNLSYNSFKILALLRWRI